MLEFIPDDPSDVSFNQRGVLHTSLGGAERCVRQTLVNASMDAQVDFFACMMAYSPIIEQYGPKLIATDHEHRCAFFQDLGGVSFDQFVTRDINPWTVEGRRLLDEVVNNARELMESLRQDKFTSETNSFGYIVKPDLSVRQVDFSMIHYFGPRSYMFSDLENFSVVLRDALRDNTINRWRSGNLSDPNYIAQMNSVPDIVNSWTW